MLSVANSAGPRRNLVIGTTVALAIVLSVILPFIDFSWLSEALGRGANLTGRTGIWQMGASFAAERPLFGFGYHSFFDPTPFSRVWALRATRGSFFPPHFHNSVLQVLIELGWAGLLAYLAVLVAGRLRLPQQDDRSARFRHAHRHAGPADTCCSADFTFLTHNTLPTILLFYVFLVAGRDYGEAGTERPQRIPGPSLQEGLPVRPQNQDIMTITCCIPVITDYYRCVYFSQLARA